MKQSITDPVELFWFDFASGYWQHMEANVDALVSLFGG